jgi:hypothetical protein
LQPSTRASRDARRILAWKTNMDMLYEAHATLFRALGGICPNCKPRIQKPLVKVKLTGQAFPVELLKQEKRHGRHVASLRSIVVCARASCMGRWWHTAGIQIVLGARACWLAYGAPSFCIFPTRRTRGHWKISFRYWMLGE